MCGITGFIQGSNRSTNESMSSDINRMTDALTHRGPNQRGVWTNTQKGIALGHRRLSICDLSDLANQPMLSHSGRQVLVFNGEIYNYKEIAHELTALGHQFRGHSDTEVMLEAFLEWGCERALKKMVGMFAFGYFDQDKQMFYLGRDRIGEKPLYYGWMDGVFIFGSELKALSAHSAWNFNVNPDSLALYLRYNCIPAPHTIYKNIHKLKPGTFLQMSANAEKNSARTVTYWSFVETAQIGIQHPYKKTDAEAVDELEGMLKRTVSEQMIADVPLGAFLSGGIDSSLIVGVMQNLSMKKVKTFTIGFQEESFNEAHYAMSVAQHLGTDHTELYVSSKEAMEVIPLLPFMYDEPFSDSSQIPTFLVSQLARKSVTVSLSGDGGDEVFAGYNRHFMGDSLWGKLRMIPQPMRNVAAKIIGAVPDGVRRQILNFLFSNTVNARQMADKIDKLLLCLQSKSYEEMYFELLTHEREPQKFVLNAADSAVFSLDRTSSLKDSVFTMQLYDSLMYLPDDILTKVDRASMAVSLESRAPFLDHRLIEFAWTLPLSMRVRNGKGKWILRELLKRYVPSPLVDRPKSGFAIPINSWLKGPLRAWAEELLSERKIKEAGYLNEKAVRALWERYLAGKENSQYRVWSILMFQAWLSHQSQKTNAIAENQILPSSLAQSMPRFS